MKKIVFYFIAITALISSAVAGMLGNYMDSCERGSMQGCYQAGVAYWQGEGAGKDIKAARSLLQIACDGGFSDACVALRTLREEESASSEKGVRAPVKSSSHYSGYIDGSFRGDIDQDDKEETIAWKKFATADLGDYYQLLVLDDDGSLLWEGPKEKDDGNPLVFSSLDFGISMPQLLIDVDHDGSMELLAPLPQSDVSPTYYRKLRWRGTYFEPLLSNALMRSSPGSNRFVWKATLKSYGTWISKLAPYSEGMAKANVMEYNKDQSVRIGTALIRFDREGATVVRWLEPLANAQESRESSKRETSADTASPQSANSYRARLSHRDHQNSRGKRLVKVKDVLRQDRANFYKRGGDSEDQRDPYFHAAKARGVLEWIEIYPVDGSSASMKEIIIYGTPLIEVNIDKNKLYIQIIQR